ncbi:hypothetical protein SynNOUM97013_00182 [Synechococcus sp. NOUM97013]|nr:hypothetical protein SynNOUM97013_00182 [Synechococcus sp. NOUM97013]
MRLARIGQSGALLVGFRSDRPVLNWKEYPERSHHIEV